MKKDDKIAFLLGGSASRLALLNEEHSKLQSAISLVNKAVGNSVLEKLTQNEALFNKLNNPLSAITNSSVSHLLRQNNEVAVKLARVTGPLSAVNKSISKILLENDGFYAHFKKDKSQLINTLTASQTVLEKLSKQNEFAVKYVKFHNQVNAVAKIINPSISTFLNQKVKNNFDSSDSLNKFEAIYLESLNQVKESFGKETQDELTEFTETLEKNPKLRKIFLTLFNGFRNAYLQDDFFKSVEESFGDYLSEKGKKLLTVSIVIVYISYFYVKPIYDAQILTESETKQNQKIHFLQSKLEIESAKMTPQEFDDCKEQFFNQMNQLVSDFETELLTRYKPQTVRKYTHVASAFVHYLHDHTSYIKFGDIKQSDTKTKFISASKWDYLYDIKETEVKNKMNVFLEFLKDQGLENKTILK